MYAKNLTILIANIVTLIISINIYLNCKYCV